jgi:DNA-directed RNA polymerase I subunit RPA49
LLLHSSDHATIDYTVLESKAVNSTDMHLKHYLAVFDPTTGRLDVTEAKKMVVRPQVRQLQAVSEEGDVDAVPAVTPSSRAALTEAFGTKKSKRAIQSIAENRLLARGGDGDDPLSQAILETQTNAEADEIDASSISRTNKPLPKPNFEAQNVKDAYPLSNLVTPRNWKETLDNLSLSYYQERISAGKSVKSYFRFVSHRVDYLVQRHLQQEDEPSIKQHIQLLRYIELLLTLHKQVMTFSPRIPIPQVFKWPEKTRLLFSTASEHNQLLPEFLDRFFPDSMRSQYAMTLLRTTILALTLHIPPPSLNFGENLLATEPTDISLDLALDSTEGSKLFRELGCKLDPPTDKELATWGLSKATRTDENGKKVALPKAKFAKLRLPLVLPKLSQGRSPGKRK